jgi:hypothetical protein
MSIPGCQWGYIELRCTSRAVRVLGEFPQASGDLYDDSAHSDVDRRRCQNNDRVSFGSCPGVQTNQTGATQ